MSVGTVKFSSSCVKTLTAVEADVTRSNQHEFNGVKELKELLGENRVSAEASFSIKGATDSCKANVTWYDAREAHETRSEYRLYFQKNSVMDHAQEGDNIVIGFDAAHKLHVLLIKSNMPGYIFANGWQKLE